MLGWTLERRASDQGETFVELRDYLGLLRKYWRRISALTLVGIAVAAVYSLLVTPTYTSTTSVLLTVQSGDSAGELASGSSYTERQVTSFAEVAESYVVLQPVIDQLGLGGTPEDLAERVHVRIPANTAILAIEVQDSDPDRATQTAAAVGQRLVSAVAALSPKDSTGQPSVIANEINPAVAPTTWTTPKTGQNLALGGLAGLFLGFAQVLLQRLLDKKVRNAEDLAALTDIPVVGTVSWAPDASKRPLAVLTAPTSLRSEEYRRLRTNLQFLGVGEGGRAIAFSSSIAGEGKTSTISNVALALASAGKRVLLVDADLRRPRVAEQFSLEGSAGLSTILIGRAAFEDVVQPVHGLDVLAAGQVPPNPSELLGSAGMRALVRQATQAYDYVLLDAAPLVPVADTAVLSTFINGVILLVGSGHVDSNELQEALVAVEAAEGTVLGLVLNKLRSEDAAARRHTYYRHRTYESLEAEPVQPARRATLSVEDTPLKIG